MAKRKSTGDTSTSKGERRSSMKTSSMHTSAERMTYKINALNKGKDVYFTIANPNKNETNKPFIKMKIDGKMYLKRQQYSHKAPVEAN